MSRVGIVGGTFDPIHLGHLALAAAARGCAGLDRVLLVPANRPPHKREGAVASPGQRLEMCRLASAGSAWLQVWDIELRRSGPSYTLDTLLDFGREHPGAEPFLVLGWDAARELGSWHDPDRVLEQARLVVVPRPGVPIPSDADLASAGLDPRAVLLCRATTPAASATAIRGLVRAGRPLEGLLLPAVARYIVQQGLYR